MKTSWRCLSRMSWRRLQNVLKTSWQDVLKASWKRIEDVLKMYDQAKLLVLTKKSWRHLEDVSWRQRRKTSSWCLHQDECLVGYTSGKDHNKFQQKLSDGFNRVGSWLESNDLIMNMKADKTKCMIFGTSQKIKNKELNIPYRHQSISKASTYKYLGLALDQTLNLNDHLTKSYKKSYWTSESTSKTTISAYWKGSNYHLSIDVNATVHFTYCSIVTCRPISMTYKYKVNSLENRAHEILFRSKSSNKRLPSTEHQTLLECF